MKDWQLDLMREQADAEAWENMHRTDPRKEAAALLLSKARDLLSDVYDALAEAAEIVEGLPVTDRYMSLAMDVDELSENILAEMKGE